jgi:hypothetical protein
MKVVSGWFEGECGAVLVELANVKDVEDLAGVLYSNYGSDCVGVDMELEGEFADGTDIGNCIEDVWAELDHLS